MALQVTVHNVDSQKIKLLTRHFIITDSTGRIDEVGPGAHGTGPQPPHRSQGLVESLE